MRGIGFYDEDFFVIKSNHNLVAESIKRIIMTNARERVGRPGFGANIRDLLFEQVNEEIIDILRKRIEDQIKVFEPRVIINDLQIQNEEDELITIAIDFSLVNDVTDNRLLRFSFEIER